MAYQSIPPVIRPPVLIEDVALAAVTTRTVTAWSPGAYSKVIIKYVGIVSAGTPAAGRVKLLFNADGAANYQYIAVNTNSSQTITGEITGTVQFVPIANFNNTSQSDLSFTTVINTAKTGYNRLGDSASNAMRSGIVIAGSQKYESTFLWANTATDITFFTLGLETDSTLSGRLIVTGYP